MKYFLQIHLMLALAAPLHFIQQHQNAGALLPASNENTQQYRLQSKPANPAFDVVIREAVCLQGGRRLEAVVNETQGPDEDISNYHFQWSVDGVRQAPGALLICASGNFGKVAVTRLSDGAVVERIVPLHPEWEAPQAANCCACSHK